MVSNKSKTHDKQDLHINVIFQKLVNILVTSGESNQTLDPSLEMTVTYCYNCLENIYSLKLIAR